MIVLKQSKTILNKVLPIDIVDDIKSEHSKAGEMSRSSSINDARTTINEIQHNHPHHHNNSHHNNSHHNHHHDTNNRARSPTLGDSRRNSREIKFDLLNRDRTSPSPTTSSTPTSSDEGISPTRKNSTRRPSRHNSALRPSSKSSIKRGAGESHEVFKKLTESKHQDSLEEEIKVVEKKVEEVVNELTTFDWVLIGIIVALILLIRYF